MTHEFFIFYAEASTVCIIILGMLIFHDMWKVNRQEKQIWFDIVLLSHIIYYISDALWAGVTSGYLQRMVFTVTALNVSNCIIIAFVAYAWLMYVTAEVQLAWRNTSWGKRLARAPAIIMCLLLIAGFIVSPTFWVSTDTEVNMVYYPVLFFAPGIYVLAAFGIAFFEAGKIQNAPNRKLFILLGIYPIVVICIGVLQIVLLTVPVFCFGSTIVLLYFYVQSLEDQISIDPLTKLNNRGQLHRYVSQESNLHKSGLDTYVIMMDVNDFKDINDSYGHAEGDRALLIVAETMKSTVSGLKHPTFLGRYGGDEFIVIAYSEDAEGIDRAIDRFRRNLEAKVEAEEFTGTLTLGIGYSMLKREKDSFQECLKRADKKAYEDKTRQKIRRRTAPRQAG